MKRLEKSVSSIKIRKENEKEYLSLFDARELDDKLDIKDGKYMLKNLAKFVTQVKL